MISSVHWGVSEIDEHYVTPSIEDTVPKSIQASTIPVDHPWKLPNEGDFETTMKDCPHNENIKKCKQFLPSNKKHPFRQRIAILSTPGEIGDVFFDILTRALELYYDHDPKVMEDHVELIHTSHVPPYGYGKTHGFTKIIRLVQHPVLGEAFEALRKVSKMAKEDVGHNEGIAIQHSFADLMDMASNRHNHLSNALRQVVRWHCRLSHVAAHTLMHNVHQYSAESTSNQYLKGLSSGISFVVRVIRADVGKPTKISGLDFKLVDKMKRVDEFIRDDVMEQVQKRNHEALHISEEESKSLFEAVNAKIKEYEEVLQKELGSTKQLSKWPCNSFWWLEGKQVEERDGDGNVNLSSLLAKELSPDCNAEYNQCFVPRDLCESAGDGKCKKR